MAKEAEKTGSNLPFNEIVLVLLQYLQVEFGKDETIQDRYFGMILFDLVYGESSLD